VLWADNHDGADCTSQFIELLQITTLQRIKFRQFKSKPDLDLLLVLTTVLSMHTSLRELILVEWKFTSLYLLGVIEAIGKSSSTVLSPSFKSGPLKVYLSQKTLGNLLTKTITLQDETFVFKVNTEETPLTGTLWVMSEESVSSIDE